MHVINSDFERPDPDLVARAKDTWVCMAALNTGRRAVMDGAIKPLRREWHFAGAALTIASENPLDTLVGMVATQYVQPGDVIVVEAAGRMDGACWGATMTWGAKESGAAGIVIDGAVLTTGVIVNHEDLPVFCRGSAPFHVGQVGGGSINVPVVCGGVIVNPGDIVLGDWDGVIVLPKDRAEEILDKTGQGRLAAYPPVGRSTPLGERGFEERLRAIDGIEWN
jgi:4-hydroxy-4-methyl-2-oxoglutarate aldolase